MILRHFPNPKPVRVDGTRYFGGSRYPELSDSRVFTRREMVMPFRVSRRLHRISPTRGKASAVVQDGPHSPARSARDRAPRLRPCALCRPPDEWLQIRFPHSELPLRSNPLFFAWRLPESARPVHRTPRPSRDAPEARLRRESFRRAGASARRLRALNVSPIDFDCCSCVHVAGRVSHGSAERKRPRNRLLRPTRL